MAIAAPLEVGRVRILRTRLSWYLPGDIFGWQFLADCVPKRRAESTDTTLESGLSGQWDRAHGLGDISSCLTLPQPRPVN